MATIIPFEHPEPGFMVGNLPMPDGTYRTYRLPRKSRNTFGLILFRWRRECRAMMKNMLAEARQSPRKTFIIANEIKAITA